MKLAIVILVCFAIAAADPLFKKSNVVAPRHMLLQQKFLFDMVHRIHEPLHHEEYIRDSDHFVDDKSRYLNFDRVYRFIELYHHGRLLPRHAIFSVFDKEHLDQALALFHLFHSANDWETFRRNVIWARVNCNEGLFVYALKIAIHHRRDLQGLILPAAYEIHPHLFFNSKVINEAREFNYYSNQLEHSINHMRIAELKEHHKDLESLHEFDRNKLWRAEDRHIYRDSFDEKFYERSEYKEMIKDTKIFYTYANYTDDIYAMNDDSKLAYFTEDLGWNSFYYNFHINYPFWMEDKDSAFVADHRRGELFLYTHQQLLARYYLERLSHRLGEIKEFSWYTPIKTGYKPHLMSIDGLGFSVRPNYWEVYSTEEYIKLNRIEDYERRIRDIIDFGIFTFDGKTFDLRKPKNVELLGNLIQGNVNSEDHRIFGYWVVLSHLLISDYHFDLHKYEIPNVMMHYETMLRDPVFYMLYKRICHHYQRFLNALPAYEKKELIFNGVRINEVTVDKLMTFFDYFDADISTVSSYDYSLPKDGKHDWDQILLARQRRLNHKAFNFKIEIESDRAHKAIVRVFLGPKFDEHGHKIDLEQNRFNFIAIDQFKYDVLPGKNYIQRSSSEFACTIRDRTTYTELYKLVMMAIDGKSDFHLDMSETHCSYPHRLVLPHGWIEGMPMQFFFIISPLDEAADAHVTSDRHFNNGIGFGTTYLDRLPFGYPLDREIREHEFRVPNMFFKDVLIYHLPEHRN